MECMIPTSGVYPIATANVKADISAPLLSRFAVIELPDYTDEEKKIIFSRFALPKVIEKMGLRENEIVITEDGLEEIISRQRGKSGIRDLEQIAEHIAANGLYQIETEGISQVTFGANDVSNLID